MNQYKVTGTDAKGYVQTVQYVRAIDEEAAIESCKMQNINAKQTKMYRAEVVE